MNRHAWVLLLMVGCTAGSQGPTAQERRAAIRTAHQEAGHHSGAGFQSTRWGMSREEALISYPQAQATPRGDLVFSTVLAEQPAQVFLLFAKGELGAVFVRFTESKDITEDHTEMVDLLTSKYGKPWRRGDTRRVQKYRESIDLAGLLIKSAASLVSQPPATPEAPPEVKETSSTEQPTPADDAPESGDRTTRDGKVVIAGWHAPATEVTLFGYATQRENLLTLHYESAIHADRLREELAEHMTTQRRQRARDL
ncbi:hypothetical protein [Myxococcus stipitatus]|nr:hypothetical protein [Myxococcus stipitatus]